MTEFIRKNPDGTYYTEPQATKESIMNGLDSDKVSSDIVLNEAQRMVAQTQVDAFPLVDEEAEPFVPLADLRVERFLMLMVENHINKPAEMYRAYKEAGFDLSGIEMQDKSSMRFLLAKKRVRERWSYLKQSEWELSKPSKTAIKAKYDAIIDDPDIKPSDKLKAIDGLLKLLGDLEGNNVKSANTTVIFNASDKPRKAKINEHIIDVEMEADE